MGLQLGIRLDLREETAEAAVDLRSDRAALALGKTSAAERRDRLHDVLVEIDRLADETRHVLQDLHALLEIVVDRRSVRLQLLLKLLEIVLRADLHEEEDQSRNDKGQPKDDLEQHRAEARLGRQLAFDHVHVASGPVHRARQFIELIRHRLFPFRAITCCERNSPSSPGRPSAPTGRAPRGSGRP